MSNSNTAQESLEIMKESEKKVVEESVNKTKYVSRSPSKEEVEKDGGEEVSVRQETQVSVGRESWALTQLVSIPSQRIQSLCPLSHHTVQAAPFLFSWICPGQGD